MPLSTAALPAASPTGAVAASELLLLDTVARTATLANQPLRLHSRAFDLLALLASQPGRVFAADELLATVWPDRQVDEVNLRIQVAALRKALGRQRIANVIGRGYQLSGPVQLAGQLPAQGPIGRDDDLRALGSLVARHRLVTVAGAGGIGKTTLVQAWLMAQPASGATAAAARWVDLAPLAQAAQIWPAVHRQLGLPEDPGDGPAAEAAASAATAAGPATATSAPADPAAGAAAADTPWSQALAGCQGILVLDNAEHLADATARLARALLDAAPGLRLLVTSQKPLRLASEALLRLGPLELPEPHTPLAQARRLGAVALFVERVRALDSRFQLTPANLALVGDICRQLDGLPLAIELAAARVPALGLAALARSLDERLRLAASHAGLAPARQRTLQAALSWSYELLDAPTQRVFQQLGSFNGPFSQTHAEAALLPPDAPPAARQAVAESLRRLVDMSLLAVDTAAPDSYRLLELPRLFARELVGRPPGGLAADATHTPPEAAADDQARRLVQRLLARRGGGSESAVDPVADSGLGPAALLALARRVDAQEPPGSEQAVNELAQAVDLAEAALAGADDEGTDQFVDSVLASVAEQTRAGDFDRGADSVDDALAELQRRERRFQQALLRSRQALHEAGVQQDLLRRDPVAVARRIESLVALTEPDRPCWSAAWRAQEDRYLRGGIDQVRSLWLAVAIAMLRRRLDQAAGDAERVPVLRSLAEALAVQGERLGSAELMADAAQLTRQALAAVTPAQDPDNWAALQHQLARVLSVLARHGTSGGPLREAIACERAALQVWTAEQSPQDWAAAQHTLGEALLRAALGRSDGVMLNEAVQAFRLALTRRSASQHLAAHAETQILLGNALSSLARRTGQRSLRHEAVAAFRSLLPLLSPSQHAEPWWRMHNALGLELTYLCEEFETGPDGAREALAVYQRALDHMPEDAMPAMRARLHHNMGFASSLLGQRLGSLAVLQQAERYLLLAMQVHTREAQPHTWAVSRHEQARVRLMMGELAGQPMADALQHLHQALAWFDELLALWTPQTSSFGHVEVQLQRMLCFTVLAQRQAPGEGADAAWQQALQAGEAGLACIDRQGAPMRLAQLEAGLARVRAALAQPRQPRRPLAR